MSLEELIFGNLKQRIGKKGILLLILIWTITFFFGNFLSNSAFIKTINPFTFLFGITDVDVNPTNIITERENISLMTFKISNTGDKNIDELFINYQNCGLPEKTALLKENSLGIGEKQYFEIETKSTNKTCDPTTSVATLDISLDDNQKCYVRISDPKSKICWPCKVAFKVFANGKLVYNKKITSSYYEVETSAFSLLSKSGTDIYIDPKDDKPFNLSDCIIIDNTTRLSGLQHKLDSISFVVTDLYTICLQGKDPEFCEENIFVKP